VGLLGLGISLLAIYFIVSQVDMSQLGEALRQARYIYVLPSALLLVLGLVTRALRWRVLLDGGLPLPRAFSITNISYLVNGLLPLRMGEVARAVLANRAQPPVPVLKSASSIVVERLLDLLAVLALLGFALAAAPTLPSDYRAAAVVIVPALVLGFGTLIVLAAQRARLHALLARITQIAPVLQKLKLAVWADHFLDGLLPLTRPALLLRALLWTGLSWGISVAAGYILMLSFYEQADWAVTALYIAAAAFVIAVPAVPGNIGTYEWAIMLAVSAMGLGQPTDPVNVSFAVIVHALNLAVYAVMGTLGFIQEGITLGQLSARVEELDYRTAP
jgi:uncharacterized protein (TIRG00374 family)